MDTPTKDEGIQSHQVSGLSEELTPASSSTVPTTEKTASQQEPSGVAGYLKSWIGGGSGNTETAPHPDQKTTHTQELKDGSTAAIHTAPQSSAVPTSLQESPHTVGSARTEFQQPVSQYASALEGIAGEPVAHDPSAKYAPALGALTGDAPASGQGTGVVGAVTAAAGNVYHGVAQAVGYEDAPGSDTTTGTTSATGTPEPQTIGSQRIAPEYETSGTGSGYEALGGSGVAGAGKQRTAPEFETSGTGSRYEGMGGSGAFGAGGVATGGSVVTPADLPKSGVVDTSSGAADITAKEQPGYLASAAGAVSNTAAGLKDRVAGIYGSGSESGTAASTGEGYAKPGIEYEEEAPAAGAGAAAGVGSATAAKAAPSTTTTTGPSSTPAVGLTTAAPSSTTGGGVSSTTTAPASTTGDSFASTKAPASSATGASSSTANPAAATEATKAAPAQAKEAATSGTAAPATKTEPSTATKTGPTTETSGAGKPTVSAFAADSKSPSKDTKAGEITEEAGMKKAEADKEKAATGAVKGAVAKSGTTQGAKQEEKRAQSKCCGCTIQ